MTSVADASALDRNLVEALESTRDRIGVLRLEQDILAFLTDASKDVLEVPSLNSYQRLLAHKTGDYYHLTHVSDASRQLILFHKHPWSKVPQQKLCEMISKGNNLEMSKAQRATTSTKQVKIMKRTGNKTATVPEHSASVEVQDQVLDREKEKLDKEERYRAARARIFQGVEESPSPLDKASKDNSRSNSRSNSRDARGRASKRYDQDAHDYVREVVLPDTNLYSHEPRPADSARSSVEPLQQRHLQYRVETLQSAYRRPSSDGRPFIGVWSPRSSTPLSTANLATLEAQTVSQVGSTPLFATSSDQHVNHSGTPPNRSLAPPANSTPNLWAPLGQSSSSLPTRNASALGLNLSASPWTPTSPLAVQQTQQAPKDEHYSRSDIEDDPANVLRGLALDDK